MPKFVLQPGLATFSTLTTGPVRGLYHSDENAGTWGRLLAVSGDILYDIASNGGKTNLGTVQRASDHVSIAYNGTQYLIVSGGLGYILTGNTLTQIADADFPSSVSKCMALDGYFIVIETDTQKFYISSQYDGTAWTALDFSSAEASPDNLISCAPNVLDRDWETPI